VKKEAISITYIRRGRKKRSKGVVASIDPSTGLIKVKPDRYDWRHIYVTPEEVAAGSETPITDQLIQKHGDQVTPEIIDTLRSMEAEIKSLKKRYCKPGKKVSK
jgi:hypothetical protein